MSLLLLLFLFPSPSVPNKTVPASTFVYLPLKKGIDNPFRITSKGIDIDMSCKLRIFLSFVSRRFPFSRTSNNMPCLFYRAPPLQILTGYCVFFSYLGLQQAARTAAYL